MIKHVRASNMQYHLHLEEEKKKKQYSEKNLEKLHLTNQINNINEDCDNLKMTIERLNEQFIQLAKKTEEKNQKKCIGMKERTTTCYLPKNKNIVNIEESWWSLLYV